MSVKRLLKTFGSLLATSLLTSVACGYVLVKDSGGYVNAWMPGTITMQVKMASSPALSDGTSQSASPPTLPCGRSPSCDCLMMLQGWSSTTTC